MTKTPILHQFSSKSPSFAAMYSSHIRSVERAIMVEESRREKSDIMRAKERMAVKYKRKYKVRCTSKEIADHELDQLTALLVRRRIKRKAQLAAVTIQRMYRGYVGRKYFNKCKRKPAFNA